MDHPPPNTEVVKQLVLDLRMKLSDFRKYWKKDFIPGMCHAMNNYFMLKDLKSCLVSSWMLKDKETGVWIMGIPPPTEFLRNNEEPKDEEDNPLDSITLSETPMRPIAYCIATERCTSCGIRKEDNEEQGMSWSKTQPYLCGDCAEGNSVFSDAEQASLLGGFKDSTEENLKRPVSKIFSYKITMSAIEWIKCGGDVQVLDDVGNEIENYLDKIEAGVVEDYGVESEKED